MFLTFLYLYTHAHTTHIFYIYGGCNKTKVHENGETEWRTTLSPLFCFPLQTDDNWLILKTAWNRTKEKDRIKKWFGTFRFQLFSIWWCTLCTFVQLHPLYIKYDYIYIYIILYKIIYNTHTHTHTGCLTWEFAKTNQLSFSNVCSWREI